VYVNLKYIETHVFVYDFVFWVSSVQIVVIYERLTDRFHECCWHWVWTRNL